MVMLWLSFNHSSCLSCSSTLRHAPGEWTSLGSSATVTDQKLSPAYITDTRLNVGPWLSRQTLLIADR